MSHRNLSHLNGADQPSFDLAALFREHAAGLAGAVRGILGPRADEQEVLQEAFLRAWKALAAGTRPARPKAWVFVLTLNLARDLRRRAARRGNGTDWNEVDEMRLTTQEAGPDARLESEEAVAAARAAIYRLGEEEKEVFLLRVSGELSFDAIAENLGIPVGTAKTRMRAALGRLRQHLHAFAPDGGASYRTEGDAR